MDADPPILSRANLTTPVRLPGSSVPIRLRSLICLPSLPFISYTATLRLFYSTLACYCSFCTHAPPSDSIQTDIAPAHAGTPVSSFASAAARSLTNMSKNTVRRLPARATSVLSVPNRHL